MTATLPPQLRFQPLAAGAPIPGGKVYFYAGGTTTPQNVYAADGTTSIGNTLTLDANGATDFRLGTGLTYKIDLKDAAGVAVAGWPVDLVVGFDGVLISLADPTNPALGDALVAVKSTATGGVARTQHGKNADYLTLEDFGAVGDWNGTSGTDDTAAVQAAVTASAKRRLVIKKGTSTRYKLTAEITVPSGAMIEGEGWPILHQTGAGLSAFVGSNLADVVVEGIEFMGPGSSSVPSGDKGAITFTGINSNIHILGNKVSLFYNGIVVLGTQNLWILRNTIKNWKLYGIVGSTSYNLHINDNNLYTCDQAGAANAYGIQVTGNVGAGTPSYRNEIIGNIIDGVQSWDGIMSHENKYMTISKNIITNCRVGIDVGNYSGSNLIDDLIITENTILLTTADTWAGAGAIHAGILVTGEYALSHFVDGLVLANNIIHNPNTVTGITGSGNNPGAIQLDSIKNAVVHDNVVRGMGNANASYVGVSLFNPGDNVSIHDNSISGSSAGKGIAVQSQVAGTCANLKICRNTYQTSGGATSHTTLDNGTYTNFVWTENTGSMATHIYDLVNGASVTMAEGDAAWTPALKFGGASVGMTYGNQKASLTRKGDKVHFQLSIILTAKGSSTGAATIAGLPFTSSGAFATYVCEVYTESVTMGGGRCSAYVNTAASTIQLVEVSGAGVPTNLTDAAFTNASRVNVCGWYLAA